jgi:hypoxanthine phosphoribosyltransferase
MSGEGFADTLPIPGLRKLFASDVIADRVRRLAEEIGAVYGNEPLVAICVLKGAFVFFSDLVRFLHNKNLEIDFVRLSSYGKGTESSGHVSISRDVDAPLAGKHVLVVEDIVDSGKTMRFLLDKLARANVLSLRLAAFIDKRERREAEVHVDFAAFRLDRGFVVGYGLDYAERWRALPAVYEIIAE